eukprot:4149189-Pleurochrysis_carterae.AAC.1
MLVKTVSYSRNVNPKDYSSIRSHSALVYATGRVSLSSTWSRRHHENKRRSQLVHHLILNSSAHRKAISISSRQEQDERTFPFGILRPPACQR